MVNVDNKGCVHGGCSKHPSYGDAGSKNAEYRAQHALDGMMNVLEKRRCTYGGWSKKPSYGVAVSKMRE